MKRESVMMYRTHCEAMKALPPEQFKAVVTALWDYELDGVEPDDADPVVTAMFLLVKPFIDKRNQNYENGKKGGRPKANTEPTENRLETDREPTVNPSITMLKPPCNLKNKEQRTKDKDIDIYPYKEVIDYLNAKAGTKFRDQSKDSRKHIKARFDEGFTLDDFKRVIDGRCAAWKGDAKMSEFLRPSTLFGTKFESYLNAKHGTKGGNAFNNFTGRDYDYESLEKMLTGVGS